MLNWLTKGVDSLVAKKGGFILAYHEISVERFNEHLDILSSLEAVPLTLLLKRNVDGKSTKGLYAITIDDTYESTISGIERSSKVPITLFIQSDHYRGIVPDYIKFYIYTNYAKRDEVVEGYFNADSQKMKQYFSDLKQVLYSKGVVEFRKAIKNYDDYLRLNHNLSDKDFSDHLKCISPETASKVANNELFSLDCHGKSHQPVSFLQEADLINEIIDCKKLIIELTQNESRVFCYPYGQHLSVGAQAPQLVAQHFDYAVTMNAGRIGGSNKFLLPRIPVFEKDFGFRLIAKTSTLFY